MRKYALCIAALWCAAVAAAQTGRSPSVSTPNSLKWGPAPSILPAGAKLAVLDGDPMKSGVFTMRLMMPPGYRIPPHCCEFLHCLSDRRKSLPRRDWPVGICFSHEPNACERVGRQKPLPAPRSNRRCPPEHRFQDAQLDLRGS
jgi:hypothetical protein